MAKVIRLPANTDTQSVLPFEPGHDVLVPLVLRLTGT